MQKVTRLLKNQIWVALKNAAGCRNSDGYLVISLRRENRLRELLEQAGFFDFHVTNNGNIIGEHQVVAFLFRGGHKALQNGFQVKEGEMEVHHFNSCPWDNRPENLQYLAVQDHKLVTEYMDQLYVGQYEDFSATPFNAQGRPIRDSLRFLRHVAEQTLIATDCAVGLNVSFRPGEFLKNLPPRLYQKWQEKNGIWKTQQEIRRRIRWIKDNCNIAELSLLRFMKFVGFEMG